jgi:hypothetical protein
MASDDDDVEVDRAAALAADIDPEVSQSLDAPATFCHSVRGGGREATWAAGDRSGLRCAVGQAMSELCGQTHIFLWEQRG